MQVLVVASHTPPALSQSAFVLAVVTSAAKADAAKATPRANANAYAMLLMGSLPIQNTTKLKLRRAPFCFSPPEKVPPAHPLHAARSPVGGGRPGFYVRLASAPLELEGRGPMPPYRERLSKDEVPRLTVEGNAVGPLAQHHPAGGPQWGKHTARRSTTYAAAMALPQGFLAPQGRIG
jgi:hypothetical protein